MADCVRTNHSWLPVFSQLYAQANLTLVSMLVLRLLKCETFAT